MGDTVTLLTGAMGGTDRDIRSCQVAARGDNTSGKCSLVYLLFYLSQLGKNHAKETAWAKWILRFHFNFLTDLTKMCPIRI